MLPSPFVSVASLNSSVSLIVLTPLIYLWIIVASLIETMPSLSTSPIRTLIVGVVVVGSVAVEGVVEVVASVASVGLTTLYSTHSLFALKSIFLPPRLSPGCISAG